MSKQIVHSVHIPTKDKEEFLIEVREYEGNIEIAIAYSCDAMQDLVMVREKDVNHVEALVWGDKTDEDYTEKKIIEIYREEE